MQIRSIKNLNTYKRKKKSLSFNLKTTMFTFTFLLCENEAGHSTWVASGLLLYTCHYQAPAASEVNNVISGKTVLLCLHRTFLLKQVDLLPAIQWRVHAYQWLNLSVKLLIVVVVVVVDEWIFFFTNVIYFWRLQKIISLSLSNLNIC